MKRFKDGQRVLVNLDHEGTKVEITGTVCRLRRADDGAWINLDSRHKRCPFPESDPRSNHIMAYPEDCMALSRGTVPA